MPSFLWHTSQVEACGVLADYLTNERLATTLPLREETLFLASLVSRRVTYFLVFQTRLEESGGVGRKTINIKVARPELAHSWPF